MAEIWYYDMDPITKACSMGFKIKKQLFSNQTPYQKIDIFETYDFGKVLVLDGTIQLAEKDEFIYHEMLAHIALHSHPSPSEILIIGGGDGCCLREVLKHNPKKVSLVDIDKEVIDACKTYLCLEDKAFEHPNAKIVIDDGAEFIKEKVNEFDVIICDATDAPCEVSKSLLTEEFYKNCFQALKEDGIFVIQAGAKPSTHWSIIEETKRRIASIFPMTKVYGAIIPSFSGCWPFIIASKKYDVEKGREVKIKTKYYSTEMHRLAFDLIQLIPKL